MTVKIHLEANGAVVAIEGEKDFVTTTIEQWRHLLEGRVSQALQQPEKALTETTSSESEVAGANKYDNVFIFHIDRLKIIADIPGTSKAEQTRNVALVLLYGEYLLGSESVTANRIKEACVDQGCCDSSNFAAHLKTLKSKVVMDPKTGGDYTVKLTAPGRKSAMELVDHLNQEAGG